MGDFQGGRITAPPEAGLIQIVANGHTASQGGRGDAGRGRVPSKARLRAVGRDAATTGGHTATRRPAVLTAAPPTERRATNNVRDAADTFPPSLILVGGGESKGASPASDRAGAPRRHAAGTPEIK